MVTESLTPGFRSVLCELSLQPGVTPLFYLVRKHWETSSKVAARKDSSQRDDHSFMKGAQSIERVGNLECAPIATEIHSTECRQDARAPKC